MSNAFNNAAKLHRAYSLTDSRFGYTVGSSNNQTAIQLAIDAALNDGRAVYAPGGMTHWAEQLTLGNIRVFGDDAENSLIKQVGGTNDNFIVVPYTTVQNPVLEDLTIDGNRANNASAGHGVYLPDHIESDASVTYGFSVVLRNAYVQNVREDCLHVGTNRNMGHVENTELKRGGRCMYVKAASDWRSFHGRYAFPLTSHAIEIESGADNVFMGGAAYGATAAACVRIKTQSVSPSKLIGMTINYNDREALYISGPSGVARGIAHVISGCWFADNSLLTDNTYAHIKLEDIANVCMTGNVFRWLGTGNRPSYLVEFAGVTGDQEWTGNSWNTVTVPYGTGITNTAFRLKTKVEWLDINGPINFNLTYFPEHADDTAAAAGGVQVGRPYTTGSFVKVRKV